MEGEQTVILWGTGLCNYSVLVPSFSFSLSLAPSPFSWAVFFHPCSQSHRWRVPSAKAHRGQLSHWNQENMGCQVISSQGRRKYLCSLFARWHLNICWVIERETISDCGLSSMCLWLNPKAEPSPNTDCPADLTRPSHHVSCRQGTVRASRFHHGFCKRLQMKQREPGEREAAAPRCSGRPQKKQLRRKTRSVLV